MNLIVLATYEAISDWDSASADDLLLAHGLLIRASAAEENTDLAESAAR